VRPIKFSEQIHLLIDHASKLNGLCNVKISESNAWALLFCIMADANVSIITVMESHAIYKEIGQNGNTVERESSISFVAF
jgi:hypothetical protein